MRYVFIFLMGLFFCHNSYAQAKDNFQALFPVLTKEVEGKEISPKTTAELEDLFNTPKGTLPRLFVKKLPDDFKEKGTRELYVKVIGALILKENEQILSEQVLFNLLRDKMDKNISWTGQEKNYFDSLLQKYDSTLVKTVPSQINDLLYKIDAIPLSLAIAQSALQTNWGKENMDSPYGQKGWQDGKTYTFIKYPDLISATKAYVDEMNGTPNYDGWRSLRMKYTFQGIDRSSLQMAQGLRVYMPEQVDYVDQVRTILRRNSFLFDLDKVVFEN